MTQVTALIRTHNRPQFFKRCMDSVMNQTAKTEYIIDSDNAPNDCYVTGILNEYGVANPSNVYWNVGYEKSISTSPFLYNLYCNALKLFVHDGWFFFLDDDDYLIDNTAIERILPYLTDPTKVVICQMQRGKYPKPDDKHMDRGIIRKGSIGMPCIFVHSSLKDSVMFTDDEIADYLYIHEMAAKHGAIFAKEVIVMSEKRRYGNSN